MQQINLTYREWMNVHPHYRSIIGGTPHVVIYDEGRLPLRRVVIIKPDRYERIGRAGNGQLRLDAA